MNNSCCLLVVCCSVVLRQAPVSPAALRKLHKRLAKYAEELYGEEGGREKGREKEGGGKTKEEIQLVQLTTTFCIRN